jgi:hypothetical protein
METCSPKQPFFSEEQITEFYQTVNDLDEVDVRIHRMDNDKIRDVFFRSGKLLHIFKKMAYALFWEKMLNHTFVFEKNGKKYWLTELPQEMYDRYKTVL